MAENVVATGILEQTAEHGFLSPATIATALQLQERMVAELLERLGGEVHIPDFAAVLEEPPAQRIAAELDDAGTYILRLVAA